MTRHLATRLAFMLAVLGPATSVAQDTARTRTLSLTTSKGTWLSLDIHKDGRALVFELLGDLYTTAVEGGQARPEPVNGDETPGG